MFQYSHIVYYQHTILQLLNKNWIYFFFLIFWHAETPSLLLGYYAAGINSSLNSIFFKSFLPFSNLICLIKKLFWLEKKLIHYAWQKKNFSEELLRQLFLINSNNQELIHHIHCFGRIYLIIKARQRNLDFIIYYFMIFNWNCIHWMSQTFLIQQNIFIFIMTYCCYSIFVYGFYFFYALTFFMLTIIIYQIWIHLWL